MLLQKQLKSNDCWRTCIASILSLPADQVPHFYGIYANDPQRAIDYAFEWLEKRDHTMIRILYPAQIDFDEILAASHNVAPNQYCIISGATTRNTDHAIISYNGVVVMDPFTGAVLETHNPFIGPMSTGYWGLEIIVGKVRGLHETFD